MTSVNVRRQWDVSGENVFDTKVFDSFVYIDDEPK